jgi:hypothetical protein
MSTSTLMDAPATADVPRHVWQSLFVMISMMRPEWPIDRIANATYGCRDLMTFPELTALAVRVAQDSRAVSAGAIVFVASGVMTL